MAESRAGPYPQDLGPWALILSALAPALLRSLCACLLTREWADAPVPASEEPRGERAGHGIETGSETKAESVLAVAWAPVLPQ